MEKELLILKPKPSPFKLIRIGGSKDGAYLVPNDLKGIESCFSPGVENRKDFEDELVLKYGINCHLCDFSSDEKKLKTPLIEGCQSLEKKWLSISKDTDSICLEEWINKYSPEKKNELMLQMDIEGSEYENLINCSPELISRFRIIIIELHELKPLGKTQRLGEEKLQLINLLGISHTCVHAHPNNNCGFFIHEETKMNIPEVLELTFLRRDRILANKGLKLITPELPNRLDITNNKILPPIHLNKSWANSNTISLKSISKILNDLIDYILFSGAYKSAKYIEKAIGKETKLINILKAIFHKLR